MELSGKIASISLILFKKKNINSINYTMGRLSVPKKNTQWTGYGSVISNILLVPVTDCDIYYKFFKVISYFS